ncbi:MAG: polynucleotide kinase [Actinobacteria bacterium]|nr:polynucleotide kinase [Actinomycetota bacterium]
MTSRPRAVVIDMDGTLASVTWRLEHLQRPGRKDWKAFFAGMGRDAPVPWVVELTNADHGGAARIIVTGRPADHREVCERWLATHGVSYDELHLRPSGDFRPDDVVKREIHDHELAPRFDISLVVDDRPRVVEMWRGLGYHVVVPTDPGLDPLDG